VCAALGSGLPGYHLFFCQSRPPPGRPSRFDLSAAAKLGWAPRDTFPADIEALCAGGDYAPDKRLFPKEQATVTHPRRAPLASSNAP